MILLDFEKEIINSQKGVTLEVSDAAINEKYETRIEIPASITATEFYRKFGYDYKNGVKELDEERHYRLEKFKEVWI